MINTTAQTWGGSFALLAERLFLLFLPAESLSEIVAASASIAASSSLFGSCKQFGSLQC